MGRMTGRIVGGLLLCWGLSLGMLRADEPAYFRQKVNDLKITEGTLQPSEEITNERRMRNMEHGLWPAYVVLDGPGEAYWSDLSDTGVEISEEPNFGRGVLCARVPGAGADLTGRLFYFDRSTWDYRKARFKIPATEAKAEFHDAFYFAKARHYYGLLRRQTPGGAWFRHQMRLATAELGRKEEKAEPAERPNFDRLPRGLEDSYALFSGGRAVSENLQLDRSFTVVQNGKLDVPIKKLSGIKVAEIEWTKLIAGKRPRLDPLAGYIPADQHVVFFPSFAALLGLADEADRQGTPILETAEPRAEDFGVVDRYRRQLGLHATALGRTLGPQVIASVALTGGDPYFRLGTDVALLFEAKSNIDELRALLAGQIALNTAGVKNVKQASDKLLGVGYQEWKSPSREVSSYLAAIDRAVIVTNSLAQLKRLIETQQGQQKAIAALDEYQFFRDRYPRGDAGETALLFLSDATIRRWCGPQWRIADSRRTRNLAVLCEVQAAAVPQLVAGKVQSGPAESAYPLSGRGPIELTAGGASSPTAGTLEFMTPIGEAPPKMVSRAEADAYDAWRQAYQRNFRWAFDPIALRLTVAGQRMAGDLTVMPLVAASEYNTLIDLSRGVSLSAESGDPHDAIAQVVLAVNRDSELMRQYSGFAAQLTVNPLSWLGKSVSLYMDDSPFWNQVAELKTPEARRKWLEDPASWQMPVAVNIEISSTLKAVAFLAALRAFVEQTAPGMLVWENQKHGEQGYVKISTTERAAQQALGGQKLAIYYALTAEALTISSNETLIKRVLDRAQARFVARTHSNAATATSTDHSSAPAALGAKQASWLGENLALTVEAAALKILGVFYSSQYQVAQQRLAWGNLPILNEWKRRFPQHDPVELHERLWGVRLICPGGGKYVWNESWQTMESTVYGHPGEPKPGPITPPALGQLNGARLGLTFEEHGLRARAELLRKAP